MDVPCGGILECGAFEEDILALAYADHYGAEEIADTLPEFIVELTYGDVKTLFAELFRTDVVLGRIPDISFPVEYSA